MSARLQPVVGMEVHAELLTASKMFCACGTDFGAPPNSRCCPVCVGLPGSLPVPNRRAVELVIKTALALNCRINRKSIFHRKNYFYPDLPKAFQISQYDVPLGVDGHLDLRVNGEAVRVRIRRVHLEEDTGKLLHAERATSFVDYNRSGVPLMEIVSEPDIHSADVAREYLQTLRRILLYLDVCDGRMEQGSLRCEPNISVRPAGTEELNAKAELKNLSSFRVVHLGVQYEAARQGLALQKERNIDLGATAEVAGPPVMKVDLSDLELRQETRRWDETRLRTVTMRVKESAHDYRYFPEPDLVPLELAESLLEEIQASLPTLPDARLRRYVDEYGLSEYDAGVLVDEKAVADYFDTASAACSAEAKKVANWMQSDWMRLFNAAGRDWSAVRVTPEHLAQLVDRVESGRITGKIGKTLFEEMWSSGKSPDTLIQEQGIQVVGGEADLLPVIDQVIRENPRVVNDIRAGQSGKRNFLVGQIMKATRGAAKPDVVQRLLDQRLADLVDE